MIYTGLTKKAMKLCFLAHKDQMDKSGLPYVFHPFHLAEQMPDEATTVTALLHDVVEDSPFCLEDLVREGFPPEVTDAVGRMTHDEALPYLDYVRTLKCDPIACTVKREDLRHNSDLSRLDKIDEKALKRVEKYKKAAAILEEPADPVSGSSPAERLSSFLAYSLYAFQKDHLAWYAGEDADGSFSERKNVKNTGVLPESFSGFRRQVLESGMDFLKEYLDLHGKEPLSFPEREAEEDADAFSAARCASWLYHCFKTGSASEGQLFFQNWKDGLILRVLRRFRQTAQ